MTAAPALPAASNSEIECLNAKIAAYEQALRSVVYIFRSERNHHLTLTERIDGAIDVANEALALGASK